MEQDRLYIDKRGDGAWVHFLVSRAVPRATPRVPECRNVHVRDSSRADYK